VRPLVALNVHLVGVVLPLFTVAQVGLKRPIFRALLTFVPSYRIPLCRSAFFTEDPAWLSPFGAVHDFISASHQEGLGEIDEVCLVACSIALWERLADKPCRTSSR
jgi:hypothetical protein